ncbi:MAG: hypothetical protein ACLFPS_05870 [Clostridia bacterium]
MVNVSKALKNLKIPKIKKKKIASKRIFKKKKELEVKIPERETESILNDPNRFFGSEFEEMKRSMFFK